MLTLTAVATVFGLGAAANLLLGGGPGRKTKWRRGGLVARRDQPLAREVRRAVAGGESPDDDDADSLLARSLPLAGLGFASALAGLASPVLALPAVLVSGYLTVPFLRNGLRKYQRNRHLLDAADSVIIPLLVLLQQFVAAAFILFGISLSRRVLAGTYDRSRQSLADVFGHLPKRVWIVHDGSEIEVDYRDVAVGDVVVVNAGEAMPVDGSIVAGEGLVDQHRLTGESVPVEKSVGDPMLAATLVVSGRFHVRVERSGSHTHASEVASLILSAADRRLQVQERGEAIAERSLPIILALAATAGIMGGLVRAVAVYLVAPGYTMRVLAPVALLRALRRAADDGILIKDGRSLELLRGVDTVVFDKTGTLTDGSLGVDRVLAAPGFEASAVLAMAAAAEGRQSHPIAQAIRQAAQDACVFMAEGLDTSDYTVGRGIRALVAGEAVLVGSPAFIAEQGLTVPADLDAQATALAETGLTSVVVAIGDRVAGLIALNQVVRPEARATVDALHRRGLHTVIISGDGQMATAHLARQCGVETVYARTLPGDKAAIVHAMQEAGRTVCFIGDGINDAGALKQADVSLSIRGSSTIAVDTAQIVLLRPDLALLPKLLDVSARYESAVSFASHLAIWMPTAALPFVFFGMGGVILVVAGHDIALWGGLSRILKSNRREPARLTSAARRPIDNR